MKVFLTLQTPHATVHSSEVADAWLAWHSMPVKTKIEQIYTGVEDVHATLTGRFLPNSKCRQGRRNSFVVFNTPESIKSYGLMCTIFPKYHIKTYFILISSFLYYFSLPKFQRARVHSLSDGSMCLLPKFQGWIFLFFPLVFTEMSFDELTGNKLKFNYCT